MQDKVLHREQCPRCAANGRDTRGDNLIVYEDHKHCMSCGYHEGGRGGRTVPPPAAPYTIPYPVRDIPQSGIAKRLISKEVCDRAGVFCIAQDDDPTRCTSKVGFPAFNLQNEIVMVKYRDFSKDKDDHFGVWVEGDRQWGILGLNTLNERTRTLIITEGEPDWLTWMMVYYHDPSVGVIEFSGAKAGLKTMPMVLPRLLEIPNIIIALDSDEASAPVVRELKSYLPPIITKELTYPIGEDANSMWMAGKQRELRALVERAVPLTPQGVADFDDLKHRAKSLLFDRNLRVGESFGFPSLDWMLGGYAPNNVYVIAGIEKEGKTTFINNLVLSAAERGLMPFYVPVEMSDEEVFDQFIAIKAGVSLLGQEDISITEEEFDEYAEQLRDSLYIANHHGTLLLPEFSKFVLTAKAIGSKVLFLDHITAATVGMGWGDIDAYVYGIKQLAKDNNICIVIVSHVNDIQEGKRITRSDLRGTRSFTKVADGAVGVQKQPGFTVVYSIIPRRTTSRTGETWLAYRRGGRLIDEGRLIDYEKQGQSVQGDKDKGVRQQPREGVSYRVPAPSPGTDEVQHSTPSQSLPNNSVTQGVSPSPQLSNDAGNDRVAGEVVDPYLHTGLLRPSKTRILRNEGEATEERHRQTFSSLSAVRSKFMGSPGESKREIYTEDDEF